MCLSVTFCHFIISDLNTPRQCSDTKLNMSYDDSVKLKRIEMDPFRLG